MSALKLPHDLAVRFAVVAIKHVRDSSSLPVGEAELREAINPVREDVFQEALRVANGR